MVFRLCYHQHGGSGLTFTPEYVDNLPVADAIWYAERLAREREHEADEIRKALKRKD